MATAPSEAGAPWTAGRLEVTWDPMLMNEWPRSWEPFTVDVRPRGDVLVLIGRGGIDAWTAGALFRTLVAVYEPCFAYVRLDLREVQGADAAASAAIQRCREFAASHRAHLLVSSPPAFTDQPAPTHHPVTAPPLSAG